MSDTHGVVAPRGATLAGADIFGMTDRGKVRERNEDQFLVASLHKSVEVRQTSLAEPDVLKGLPGCSAYLLVVADGVGGQAGGELASGTAVKVMATHLSQTAGCFYKFDVDEEHAFLEHLEDAVVESHHEVRGLFADAERGPATTLTLVALVWPRAYIVHVGDSRGYYLRDGRLRQLTRDQTAYEDVLDDGTMTEAQVEQSGLKSRLRNTLTSAVGTQMKPSIGLVDLQPGDALLLCTDGLTKHVADDEITRILGTSGSAAESCRRFIDLTLERGARDNVTVVVALFPGS
jgi:serine/threonine protein phosphatase PrpC